MIEGAKAGGLQSELTRLGNEIAALGAVNLYFTIRMSAQDFAGYRMDYEYPYAVAATLAPVILGAAFLAAVGPAETAVRGNLVEALEYE